MRSLSVYPGPCKMASKSPFDLFNVGRGKLLPRLGLCCFSVSALIDRKLPKHGSRWDGFAHVYSSCASGLMRNKELTPNATRVTIAPPFEPNRPAVHISNMGTIGIELKHTLSVFCEDTFTRLHHYG